VFLTADQNLRYQQNLSDRSIAIVELPFIRRSDIPQFVKAIRAAIVSAYLETTFRSSQTRAVQATGHRRYDLERMMKFEPLIEYRPVGLQASA